MAKKKAPVVVPETSPSKVYSERYKTNIGKATAVWSEKHNSFINEKIENQLKNNKTFNPDENI